MNTGNASGALYSLINGLLDAGCDPIDLSEALKMHAQCLARARYSEDRSDVIDGAKILYPRRIGIIRADFVKASTAVVTYQGADISRWVTGLDLNGTAPDGISLRMFVEAKIPIAEIVDEGSDQ